MTDLSGHEMNPMGALDAAAYGQAVGHDLAPMTTTNRNLMLGGVVVDAASSELLQVTPWSWVALAVGTASVVAGLIRDARS